MLLSQPLPNLRQSFKRPHLLLLVSFLVPFTQMLPQYLAHQLGDATAFPPGNLCQS